MVSEHRARISSEEGAGNGARGAAAGPPIDASGRASSIRGTNPNLSSAFPKPRAFCSSRVNSRFVCSSSSACDGTSYSWSMSECSATSGKYSGDSNEGDPEAEQSTDRQAVPMRSGSNSSSRGVGSDITAHASVCNIPEPLLASIMLFLLQKERISVVSLVCKDWLRLIRSRLCQQDMTIHILPGLLTHLQQLPPESQRSAIRTIAAFGRHAKLMINPQEPLQPSRHGGSSQFSVLRALLLELRDIRCLNVSIRCPVGSRLFGPILAGVLQRSAHSLQTLEVWERDLADAIQAALVAEPVALRRQEVEEAFIDAATSLEAAVAPHVLRSDGNINSNIQKRPASCGGMLTATAHILRQFARRPMHFPTKDPYSNPAGRSLQQHPQHSCHASEPRDKDGVFAASGRSPQQLEAALQEEGTTAEIRRSITAIENCCCCLAAAETAFRLWQNFQAVRLKLPRLRSLATGSWRLLQPLHCPALVELKLSSSTFSRPSSRPPPPQQQETRHQQQREEQFHPLWAAGNGTRITSVETAGVPDAPRREHCALQSLLLFLLRCGSNLRELHGYYCVGAFNEALIPQLCAAASALTGTGHAPPPAASASLAAGAPTAALAARLHGQASGVLSRAPLPSAAVATSEGLLEGMSFSAFSDTPQTNLMAPVASPVDALRNLATRIAFGNVRASSDIAAPLGDETLKGVIAAAAVMCATAGDGCKHRRHIAGRCCAVPCAWGPDGELLLVVLPTLQVARIPDLLLLGMLLLPRLEELRLPDIWDTVVSNPTAGFALLWAYLSAYGGRICVLETKGTAPPLAAFLGAGTAAEPVPSAIRAEEAAAAKTLRLVLSVHRMHPLMDPTCCGEDEGEVPDGASRMAAAAAANTAADAGGRNAAMRTQGTVAPGTCILSSTPICLRPRFPLQQRQQQGQQQERPLLCRGNLSGDLHRSPCSAPLATPVCQDSARQRGRFPQPRDSSLNLTDEAGWLLEEEPCSKRILYGLKFGQLQRLQCHSSFLPYLTEPVPQCGSLRILNTEGDSEEVARFVALFKSIHSLCIRDPCLMPRRRPRVPEGNTDPEGQDTDSSSCRDRREVVQLGIQSYAGSAFFFDPRLRCPNLRQMQLQRGDDLCDSFLVGGGAPNLQVLHYHGRLFGCQGLSAPRTPAASPVVRLIGGSERSEEHAQQLPPVLDLAVPFPPLRLSPFANLRELHAWTLDARTVVRMACAVAAATNPQLARAWQILLRSRKEKRHLLLQQRRQASMQRRQLMRQQESTRLMERQRRLYEAYSTRRRRLRRLYPLLHDRQRTPREGPQWPEGPQRPSRRSQRERREAFARLLGELRDMREQLQQLQRRLEALAAGGGRLMGTGQRLQENELRHRHQRFREGLQRLRRIRSYNQRLVALRRLMRTTVASSVSSSLEGLRGNNDLRWLDELEVSRRKAREQRGREKDFGCSRSWCFWACHRAVAALSQLLPQLRICVVQQLRGNISSLRLLLRGLPRLELFAVEETLRSPKRKRLLQLATSAGFTVRRGSLVIPALRSHLLSWGGTTISREFRIFRRSPAGVRGSASAIAAAESLIKNMLGRNGEGRQPLETGALGRLQGNQQAQPAVCLKPTETPLSSLSFAGAQAAKKSVTSMPGVHHFSTLKEPVTSSMPISSALSGVLADGNRAAQATGMSFLEAVATGREAGGVLCQPFRAVRCSVYSCKRRRGSTSLDSEAGATKLRCRSTRDLGRSAAELQRRDVQMATALAEKLEEQLTS